jgi:hypothetical protein
MEARQPQAASQPFPSALVSDTTIPELVDVNGIPLLPENDTVLAKYKAEETIGNLKYRLLLLKDYPVDNQQLYYSGEAILDTRLIQDFALETGPLDLKTVNVASSAAASKPRSSHFYQGIRSEESAQQFVGNIGILSDGSSFGSHKYVDIRSSGHSMQVVGDMTSFPPGFGAARKD